MPVDNYDFIIALRDYLEVNNHITILRAINKSDLMFINDGKELIIESLSRYAYNKLTDRCVQNILIDAAYTLLGRHIIFTFI